MQKPRTRTVKLVAYILLIALMVASVVYEMLSVDYATQTVQSGVYFEQSAQNFTSDDLAFTSYMWPDDNHVRQEFVPKHEGLSKIAVRVENEKPAEMKGDLIFELRDESDTIIFSKTVSASDIVNLEYLEIELGDVSPEQGKTYSVEIYVGADKETHPYRLSLSGVEIPENVQLYSYGFTMDGQLDIIYTYTYSKPVLVLNQPRLLALLAIVLMVIVCVLDLLGVTAIKTKHAWPVIFVEIAYLVGLLAIVEYLSQGDITKMSIVAIAINTCIYGWIYLLVLLITNSRSVSVVLTTVLLFVLAVINHYTLLYRGTVLLPSDIYSIGTAMEVVGNYSLGLDVEILFGIRVSVALIVICVWLVKGKNKANRIVSGALLVLIGIGCGIQFTNTKWQKTVNTQVELSAQTNNSHKYGFLLNGGENIRYAIYRKPKQYSKEKVEDLLENAETVKSSAIEEAENIILIMNESYADFRYLGEVETTKPILPNLDALAGEPNCKVGKVVVDVYGGGTSCTEFEALTGCTMVFLGDGNAPYQQYVHKKTDSMATYLKDQGFDTVALHPANPKSWNRNTAYPLIGFDRFLSNISEEFENAEKCRWWIGDEAFMKELNNQLEVMDNDLFEFGLTIQCHGGYDYQTFNNTVRITNYDDVDGKVSQYLTLLNMSDESFGELIEKLRTSDEKTVVMMFGDHYPSLPDAFYRSLSQGSVDYAGLPIHETPYVIWANYDIDVSDFPDVLSANYLAPYLLKASGKDLTGFFSFLYDLSKEYPIISRWGIYDTAMNKCEYAEGTSCYEAIHDYEMAQYYLLK